MTHLTQMLLLLLLQSTALLTLGLLALHLTRKRGPAVQTLIGRASLASVTLLVLLLPLTGHVPPAVRVGLTPVRSSPTLPPAGSAGAEREGEEAQTLVGVPLAAPSALNPSLNPSSGPVSPLLGARGSSRPPALGGPLQSDVFQSKEVGSLWGIVSLPLLLWLGVCRWHLMRLRRTAQTVAGPAAALLAEISANPPRLLTHPSVHSPFLAGCCRPAIFLPDTYEADFDAGALRAIFVHELAHRDRRDNLWTLAARLFCALLWPQPLLWLLVRKLEHISEDACDEAVLARDCPPRAYADCLLFLAARPPLAPRQRILNAGVAPFRSSVGRRIRRILTLQGDRPMPPITTRLRLTAAAFALAAALGGAFLVSSAPAQVSPPAAVPVPKAALGGQGNTGGQIERAKLKEDLAKHKIELAEALMDDDLTHQRLTQAVHEALPQASPEKWQEAFDLEGRIGWSLSALKLWKTSKAASLMRHHPQSVAKFERFEGETLARLSHDTAKETEVFPQTAQAARQLSSIHVLSEHLYTQNIKVFECRVETEAFASMFPSLEKPPSVP